MAPPENIQFPTEDDRVTTILNSIPINWKIRFLKAIIQAGEESCLTSERLLKLIEEEEAREADSEPIAVSINRIFCIQFNFRERNAYSNLLNNLETGCNGIVSDQPKNEIILMLFINQLPNKLKREFKENKLPSMDEIRSFSRKHDLIFYNASVFSYESDKKRTLERKNSKNDEKNNEKKINDKTFNNGDIKQVKKEKSYDIKFQNLSSLIDYSSIALTNELISDNLNLVKVGLDSCASINSITLDDFQKLSQDIKNSVVKEEEIYILKSIHNTESITTGYFETTISLPEFKITNVPIKFFIDPNAKLTLLSYNFCKEIKLNPFTTPTNNENSDHIYLNIKFNQKCKKLKNFLNESISEVLIDPDYEPGNKIEVSFKVNENFQGKRYPFIPKSWLRKINKNELISEGWNQAIIVERPGKQPRICCSCVNFNKYIQLPEMVDLPNIRKILFEANTTVFSCWDINSAFSRITISPECRKYFNIITPIGLYQSNVLVFRMKSSPAIYYNTMIEIMKGLEKYLIIYLDYILNIAPEDIHEEINIELLKRLRCFNFKLSNEKCCVSVKKLTFLCFQIEVGKGFYIDEDRMNFLLQIKTLQSEKELRSVLAKFQFCSAFIPNFSIALKNLYSYINRKDKIEEEIKNDFKNLLDTVAKAVCLQTVPKDTLALKIYVDFSFSATSSILFC
uniref:Reverse transcriptase domain-containing protein n=1 Tax=Strongyloides stercoralis TaxID=6248 RepID=A0A0K0EFL4_STRER